MFSSARRALTVAGVTLVVLLFAGATYQGVATAIERRDFPQPGQKIDVGDHQLHVYCTGEGAPAVVLEAPALGMSSAWAWVQSAVATKTRVCSYDRAGLGWSEEGDVPFDPRQVPEQLRAAVVDMHLPTPFVLVGDALGAAFARMYAGMHPEDVAALLLVNAPVPGSGQPGAGDVDGFVRLVRSAPWLARAGVLRASRLLSENARGLPEPAGGAMRAFLNRPDHLARAAIEVAHWHEVIELAQRAPLASGTRVETVETGSRHPGALLSDRAAADAVTSAVLSLVDRVRR